MTRVRKTTIKSELADWEFIDINRGFWRMIFRLRRDKWCGLKVGDFIEFRVRNIPGNILRTKVVAIVNYLDFPSLLEDFNRRYGVKSSKLSFFRRAFPKADVKKFTVLGIIVRKTKLIQPGMFEID